MKESLVAFYEKYMLPEIITNDNAPADVRKSIAEKYKWPNYLAKQKEQ